ncbi:hypothetical protein DPW01_01330 [Aggregatibacter aphrophilus]|nr:hypothetical protein DPW01_01330 [Aggregatibacter aphrophilus]
MLFPIRDKIKTMKNKVIRKVFFPLILAKDQKNCDGFGEIKNITKYEEIIRKEKMDRLDSNLSI